MSRRMVSGVLVNPGYAEIVRHLVHDLGWTFEKVSGGHPRLYPPDRLTYIVVPSTGLEGKGKQRTWLVAKIRKLGVTWPPGPVPKVEPEHACPACDKRFCSADGLAMHVDTKHPPAEVPDEDFEPTPDELNPWATFIYSWREHIMRGDRIGQAASNAMLEADPDYAEQSGRWDPFFSDDTLPQFIDGFVAKPRDRT